MAHCLCITEDWRRSTEERFIFEDWRRSTEERSVIVGQIFARRFQFLRAVCVTASRALFAVALSYV